MDDKEDEIMPWRRRTQNQFQMELEAAVSKRERLGKDGNDPFDSFGTSNKDYKTERPIASKRRQNPSSDLSEGLGTQTWRAGNLSRILNRSLSDDDEEEDEIVAANLGKSKSRESWQSDRQETPSPKQQSKYLRKAARKNQIEKSEPLFGRKTPTREISPHLSLQEEDSIFGRRTPTIDGKKSPKDGSLKHILGEDRNKQRQSPTYKNVSPRDAEYSRRSRGVSSIDSSLEDISESSKGKITPRIQRKEKKENTEALTSHGDKPNPQMRSKVDKSKTPPLVEQHRKSPSYQKEAEGDMKRTTPTLDIFGQSRSAAAKEVEKYIGSRKDRDEKEHKSPRAETPESVLKKESRAKTPDKSTGVKFAADDRNSLKGRKTPTDSSRTKLPLEKKSADKKLGLAHQEASLLDFLMEDNTATKPEPRERRRRSRGKENQDILEDIFGNTPKTNAPERQKSPGPTDRKTPEHARKSPVTADKQEDVLKTLLKQQKAEDTSSLCEEIPMDPNRKLVKQEDRKQTTDRAQADDIIDTIAVAQTMKYIMPDKTRPRTASARVQHRPKPRYAAMSGDTTKSLQERQFNSTADIRDAIYVEWYKEHLSLAKKKKKEEEKKAKEEEEKKKKAAEEKHLEAELSYKAWMEQKKKVLSEEHKRKEKQEKFMKEKEIQEKKEQKEKSKTIFESWKVKKDAEIKKELISKKEEEKKVEEEKKRKAKEIKDRESAHKSWLNKKEEQLLVQVKGKKKEEKEKRNKDSYEREELMKKEESAENLYFQWLEKKEMQATLDKKKTKKKMQEEEFKPAWSPASHTIPFGR